MKCLGHDNVRLKPENVKNIFEHCSWCDKVSSRMNGKPLAEGILKERLRDMIESHGMCKTCYEKEYADTSRRSTLPPAGKPQSSRPLAPMVHAEIVLLRAVA